MKRGFMGLRRLFAGIARERSGAAAIEFAFAMPILLTALLGTVEFGRIMWTQNALHYAVEEAARCMTFNVTTCSSTSTIQSYAASVSGLSFGSGGTTFTPTTGAACGGGVTGNKVAASYPFPFVTSLFNYNVTLTAQACFPTG